MDLQTLTHIGLTEGEFAVYNALLELGETTRTELASTSGISPSKIYDVTNRLHEKGIISIVKKNGVQHFAAADPQTLHAFIKKKQDALTQEQELINQLMPTLLLKHAQVKQEQEVEVFTGWEGMKTVFDDKVRALINTEHDYIYGASAGQTSAQADIFFSQYYREKRKKGFGTKIIFNENMRENKKRTSIFYEKPNEIRFLEQETYAEINTYKDVVLFILLLKQPIVIRIKSKEAAHSCKQFFDALWRQAKN